MPGDAIPQAERAAVDQAGVAYPNSDLRGIRVTSASIVGPGTPRSADAGRCGLYGRTVLVGLDFPDAPFHSASLSQGAVYVARIAPPHRAAFWQFWESNTRARHGRHKTCRPGQLLPPKDRKTSLHWRSATARRSVLPARPVVDP